MTDHVFALRYVRLFRGEKRLEAVLEAPGQPRRTIKYSWQARTDSDAPPADWYEAVKKEVEYQDSARKRGMIGGY